MTGLIPLSTTDLLNTETRSLMRTRPAIAQHHTMPNLYPGESKHIRFLHEQGMTPERLAARYRVSIRTINRVLGNNTQRQAA